MKYDNGGYKFLRIKNWQKYQPDTRLRNKEARLSWVKDYTDREQDVDFRALIMFQRAMLEGLCRLAGTTPSRSIHNDPTYISRALHVNRTDIPHVSHALATLQSRGFIIPTNTEKFSDDEDEFAVGERDRDEREEMRDGEREGEEVSESVSHWRLRRPTRWLNLKLKNPA